MTRLDAVLAGIAVCTGCTVSSYRSDPPPSTVIVEQGGESHDGQAVAVTEPEHESSHPHGGAPGQTGQHPQGGPPGQTGQHPQGGPPGQTGQHPQGTPPGQAPQATTTRGRGRSNAGGEDANRGHGNDADGQDDDNPGRGNRP